MSIAGLAEHLARVCSQEDHAAFASARVEHLLAQDFDASLVGVLDASVRAIAARETSELVEIDAACLHLAERHAAVEQVLRKPAPRAFPQPPRIDPDMPILRIHRMSFMGGFSIATRLPGETARMARKRERRERRALEDRERRQLASGGK